MLRFSRFARTEKVFRVLRTTVCNQMSFFFFFFSQAVRVQRTKRTAVRARRTAWASTRAARRR